MGYFEKVFRALNKEKVKYLVVGGVAVNLHGYLRATGDIDILLLLEEGNLLRMKKAMEELGYIERLPISIQNLKDHKQVKKWLKEKGMTAFAFSPPPYNPLMLDILVEESLKFEDANKKSIKKIFEGVTIPVVCIQDLIRMKKKSDREKDMIDLKALIKLKNL
jgi:hypothetical protein